MYKKIEKKGCGSYGEVFVVEREGKKFALKKFSPKNPEDFKPNEIDRLRHRFIREVKSQSTFHHKNVMPILFSNLNEDSPYFVMPLGLHNFRVQITNDQKKEEISPEPLFNILDGLEYIHDKGFVHRDLRPDNIIYLENRYVIADFGFILDIERIYSRLSKTDDHTNPYYSAPEIFSDFANVTRHADIYSFGCILCELINGRILKPHFPKTAPGKFGPIVAKCTQVDPEDRYESVRELRNALSFAFSMDDIPDDHFEDQLNHWQNIILHNLSSISIDTWQRIFDFAENASIKESGALLSNLGEEHFNIIKKADSILFSKLLTVYQSWVKNGDFVFEYCDTLANRLLVLYGLGDEVQKSKIAMTTFDLGMNNHRFYVMHKFLEMANQSIPDALGLRIANEFIALGFEACQKIRYLLQITDHSLIDLSPQIGKAIKFIEEKHK